MASKVDYHAMSLEALQEAHSRLCGEAHDRNAIVPEHLTVDFDTADAGAEICTELAAILGLATEPETVLDAPVVKKPKAKKGARGAPKAAEGESTVSDTTKTEGQKAVQRRQRSAKGGAAKAKKAAKKTAKKGAAKKTATKRVTGEDKTGKVVALMQRAKGVTREEVLAATGWKAISMQQVAEGRGKLVIDKSERPFKYKLIVK